MQVNPVGSAAAQDSSEIAFHIWTIYKGIYFPYLDNIQRYILSISRRYTNVYIITRAWCRFLCPVLRICLYVNQPVRPHTREVEGSRIVCGLGKDRGCRCPRYTGRPCRVFRSGDGLSRRTYYIHVTYCCLSLTV